MSEETKEVVESVPATDTAPVVEETKAEGIEIAKVDPSTEAPVVGEAPAYVPNLKFKVHEEEKEFDEFLKPAIKDAETEKKIRELYEKAYGLDAIKPKHEELKTKYPEMEQKYNELQSTIKEVMTLRDKDLDSFFEQLGLKEDQIAKWMLQKLEKLNLPPEQRQVYDQYEETRRRNYALEKQIQDIEARTQAQAVQARTLELETVLQRPEVAAIAKSYDSARKQTGAFRELVIREANAEFRTSGRDLTAMEAAKAAMDLLGEAYTSKANEVSSPAPVTTEKPLPVLPRVTGKSVSPTNKQPRSIDDLKKLASNMQQ